MKHCYTILLFLLLSQLLNAQSNTAFQLSTEKASGFITPKVVDAKKHVLNLLQDEKSIFRFGFESLSYPSNDEFRRNLPIGNGIFANYEHRIDTGFSINFRLNYHRFSHTTLFQKIYTFGIDYYVIHRFSLEFAPRWYFLKKKEIQNGKSGNNLSGLYFGSTIGMQHWQRPGSYRVTTPDGRNYDPYLKSNFQYSTLNIGWQRRFNKQGFLHLQLGAGIRRNEAFDFPVELLSPDARAYFKQLPKWQSLMTYKVGLGIALGKAEDTLVSEPILQYHQEDVTMWKLDLLPIFLGTGRNTLLSKINIGYERGIKRTSFSLNTNLTYLHYGKQDYQYYDSYLGVQISPRFYYNLSKRQAVNNLSANYFSIRNQWDIIREYNFNDKKYSFALLWGMQRRLFGKMFINYELGYQFGNESPFDRYYISDLKIGLAL